MSLDPETEFNHSRTSSIRKMANDKELRKKSRDWLTSVADYGYDYNFDWFGRPIIQLPQDIIALQEIIWEVKPDLIIETGVARGGSTIFYASLLALLDLFDSWDVNSKRPTYSRKVLAIEIDLKEYNRKGIVNHPLSRYIEIFEGSSVDPALISNIQSFADSYPNKLVVLDSNHTHEHVLSELNLYSQFVSIGSYLVVMDTGIEEAPLDHFPDRTWGKGNNPMTAVNEFLSTHSAFQPDDTIDSKLQVTVAPKGYLKRIH